MATRSKKDGPESTNGASIGPIKIEKWAAISGRWKLSKSAAVYLGPEKEETAIFPMGLALAPPRFRDGTISTTIKLERAEKTTAGIVVGYQSLTASYWIVSIGGFGRAYTISEFLPGFGFVPRSAAGSLSNLAIDQKHILTVRVAGQTVEMVVDEVEVLRFVFPRPLEGSGFGLFAWDNAKIEFSDTEVRGIEPRIFVIMPFKEPFDTLYKDVIFPVASDTGFEVTRVDEIHGPGVILNDIQRQIEQSHAVVAEISTHNPNVYYELGYAHAMQKPAVLLVRRQEETEMPFDVRGYRAIFYDDSIGGKKTVETRLEQHLKAILRDS